MRLVTETGSLEESFSDEDCVRILAGAGFDAMDWSFFSMLSGKTVWCGDSWKEHALRVRETAKECKIGFSQSHAPFPSSKGEEPFDTEIYGRILRSMEAAAFLGAKHIVVHPRQHLDYAKNRARLWEENVAFYRSLIPYCEEYGIRVCMENMWQYDSKRHYIVDSVCSQPEEFCGLLDEVDSPWIAGCLDIGHAALTGVDPADFIRAMGKKRLAALHVQDVNHVEDCHTLPYLQKLDWESVAAALGEIGYEGDFTFEADSFTGAFPAALKPDACVLMAKTGRYLMERIAAYRAEQNK